MGRFQKDTNGSSTMFCCDYLAISLDVKVYSFIGGNHTGNSIGAYSNGNYFVCMKYAFKYIADVQSSIGAALSFLPDTNVI